MANQPVPEIRFERLNKYVNLERYPIHEPDGIAGRALIAQARQMMERDTLCLLEGFLRADAVTVLATEITQLEPEAHQLDYCSTPYGWMNNAGFPPEHPRSQLPRRRATA